MSTLQTYNLKHPDASDNQITFTSGGDVNFDNGAVYLDSANNRLGIGTTSPDMSLHVQSDSSYAYVAIEGGSTFDSGINLKRNGSNQWFIFNDATNNDVLQIEGGGGSVDQFVTVAQTGNIGIGRTVPGEKLDILSTSGNCLIKMQAPVGSVSGINAIGSNVLALQTGFSDKMRIDGAENGRILIGTSSIIGNTLRDSYYAKVTIVGRGDATGQEGRIALVRDEDSSNITSGESIGAIYFSDNQGGTYASILGVADGPASGNDYPGALTFRTTSDGDSAATERMKIDDEGIIYHNSRNHGIGSFITASAGTTKYIFRGHYGSPNGSYGGTISFTVWSNGNVQNTNNSYTAISDIKLKENVVDANSQWADLKALRVRNYNFKEGQTHRQIGLVAQEVEQVSPGLVYETPDRDDDGNDLGTTTKVVQYSVLYMKAVKALQEAMERIETLEQRLSDAGIA